MGRPPCRQQLLQVLGDLGVAEAQQAPVDAAYIHRRCSLIPGHGDKRQPEGRPACVSPCAAAQTAGTRRYPHSRAARSAWGARLDGAEARDRSARHSRRQEWSGSSEHPPPAGRQCLLGLSEGGLHPGGEEQCESRAARPAGIHLAGRLDPVGQLTGTDERGRENDLAGEQTV